MSLAGSHFSGVLTQGGGGNPPSGDLFPGSGDPVILQIHLTQNMLWAFSLLLQLQSCHSVHCMVNLLATFVAVDRYYLLYT